MYKIIERIVNRSKNMDDFFIGESSDEDDYANQNDTYPIYKTGTPGLIKLLDNIKTYYNERDYRKVIDKFVWAFKEAKWARLNPNTSRNPQIFEDLVKFYLFATDREYKRYNNYEDNNQGDKMRTLQKSVLKKNANFPFSPSKMRW